MDGKGAFDLANLRQRALSAAILIPLALLAVFHGGVSYAGAVTLVVALGLREWLRLIDPLLSLHVRLIAYAALLSAMAVGFLLTPAFGLLVALLMTLVLFVAAARKSEATAGWIATGIPYMAGSGLALLELRGASHGGAGLVCYLFAVVWGTDIGAYFAGRLIGGPKLAPSVSPNKTWAGLIGGMALAALLGTAAARGFEARDAAVGCALALLLACAAQVGDLFKSFFKRRAGVKDSGALIPGHGGVLDRIDGLAFAAMFLVLFDVALDKMIAWW